MKTGLLWQVCATTSEEGEEAVAALLGLLFGQTPSVYTAQDSRQSVVTVYATTLPGKVSFVRATLARGLTELAACGLGARPLGVEVRKVAREDWTESWKKYFKTIEVGRALLIKPSWSKRRARNGQAVVLLDPGLSFGTGQHPTTSFCLRQLLACRTKGRAQSFLDIGTGSGILAIAAAKLRYRPVWAFDHDPLAVRVAKANAKRNRVERRVSVSRRDLSQLAASRSPRCDLVCANLVSDLLIKEADRILNCLRSEGKLVLAGILANEFSRVQRAFEIRGLKLLRSKTEGGWQSGVFARVHPNTP